MASSRERLFITPARIPLAEASHVAKPNSKGAEEGQALCREWVYGQGTGGICFTKNEQIHPCFSHGIFCNRESFGFCSQVLKMYFPFSGPPGGGRGSPRPSLRLVLLGFVYGLAASLPLLHSSFAISFKRPSNIYWVFSAWQALS